MNNVENVTKCLLCAPELLSCIITHSHTVGPGSVVLLDLPFFVLL